MNNAEPKYENEKQLLMSVLLTKRALESVPYLVGDAGLMHDFTQFMRQVVNRCSDKWPKAAQYFQTYMQDYTQLLATEQGIKLRAIARSSRPSDLTDSNKSSPGGGVPSLNLDGSRHPSRPRRKSPTLLPGASPRHQAVKPIHNDSSPNSANLSSVNQLIFDLLADDSVSVCFGPKLSFQGADASTKIVNAQELLKTCSPMMQKDALTLWLSRDTSAGVSFESDLAKMLPPEVFVRKTSGNRKRPHEVIAASSRQEKAAARNKKRKKDTTPPPVSRPSQQKQSGKQPPRASQATDQSGSAHRRIAESELFADSSNDESSSNFTLDHFDPAPRRQPSEESNNTGGGGGGDDDDAGVNGEELYTVECIRDMRKNQVGREFFLIKWEGYSEAENTWEPIEHLQTYADHASRIRHLRAWYSARMRVSQKLQNDPNYEWQPVSIQDQQLEPEIYEFIEQQRKSEVKFHILAQQWQAHNR